MSSCVPAHLVSRAASEGRIGNHRAAPGLISVPAPKICAWPRILRVYAPGFIRASFSH